MTPAELLAEIERRNVIIYRNGMHFVPLFVPGAGSKIDERAVVLSALRGVEAAREKRIADEAAATNLLQQEWGPSYDTKVAQAARAARYFGGQQLIDFLNQSGAGNNPHLVRAFAKIALTMAPVAALSEVTP